MKKVLGLLAIVALASCGTATDAVKNLDSTVKAGADSVKNAATAGMDSLKNKATAAGDSLKAKAVEAVKAH